MNDFAAAMKSLFDATDKPAERYLVIQGQDMANYMRVGGLEDLEMTGEANSYRSRKSGYRILIPPGPLGQDMLPPEMRYKPI